MSKMTFETLVYDEKARKEFFDGMEVIIKMARDHGHLRAAIDWTKKRNEIRNEINLLIQ